MIAGISLTSLETYLFNETPEKVPEIRPLHPHSEEYGPLKPRGTPERNNSKSFYIEIY